MTTELLLQVGLGQLRLSPSAFYDMTFADFLLAWQGFNQLEQMRQREEWERARWTAAAMLSPHSKPGQKLKPSDLCIFPWEEEQQKTASNPVLFHALKQMADGKT